VTFTTPTTERYPPILDSSRNFTITWEVEDDKE
jgi:hypothetical protein